MIFGAILAGGSGRRMGSGGIPKQFLMIGGKEIILHTVGNMLSYRGFDRLFILCPEDWVGKTRELIRSEFGDEGTGLIEVFPGGETRTETLMAAVSRTEELDSGDGIIVTHDAVRPFVSERMIRESVEKAMETGASVCAVPSVDTILVSASGKEVEGVPDRKTLFNAQTPQTFSVPKLRRLFCELSEEEKERLTDGTSIFTLRGEPVSIVMGESSNIKITYPADLIMAEAILEARGETRGGKERA